MNRLFEDFVRNFYRIEQTVYSVRREHSYWRVDQDIDHSREYLPRMETDITLEHAELKIIIDTKFYQKTMQVRSDRKKSIQAICTNCSAT